MVICQERGGEVRSTPEGQALMELMWELAQTFFKMRAAGKEASKAIPKPPRIIRE